MIVLTCSNHLTRLGQRWQRSAGWWAGARRQVGRALLERSHCAEGGHCECGGLLVLVLVVPSCFFAGIAGKAVEWAVLLGQVEGALCVNS